MLEESSSRLGQAGRLGEAGGISQTGGPGQVEGLGSLPNVWIVTDAARGCRVHAPTPIGVAWSLLEIAFKLTLWNMPCLQPQRK